jgi:hypothetical protein
VGTVGVGVLDVDPKDVLEVAAPDDQEPVQALGAHRPDPALRMGVRVAPASADLGTLGDLREPQSDAVVPVGCGGLRPALKGGTIAVHRVQLERRLTQVALVPPNNLRLQWG